MVAIDIHSLNLEELTGVVNLYPWYAAARRELCARMAAMGLLTAMEVAEVSMYMGDRSILASLMRRTEAADYKDTSAPAQDEPPQDGRPVFVVGGDYFSRNDYERVREPEDNIFSRFATKAYENGYVEPQGDDGDGIYTETLAQIYLDQGYPDKAKDIYSKLILRYPEKSVYFASLIGKIDSKE